MMEPMRYCSDRCRLFVGDCWGLPWPTKKSWDGAEGQISRRRSELTARVFGELGMAGMLGLMIGIIAAFLREGLRRPDE